MHLELLKDLKLMDFEGIYNVSSHPNTLYVRILDLQDWLTDTVLLTEEAGQVCSGVSVIVITGDNHLVRIIISFYRVCITFCRAMTQPCQGYNNIFVFHGGFCSVITKVEPCNLLVNLHALGHGKMCLKSTFIDCQEQGGERSTESSAFTKE